MNNIRYIVLGEKNGTLQLVSATGVGGMLPKGSYLTVEDGGQKTILRVDDSQQSQQYNPSPLIADMELPTLNEDRKCQNIINAYRVRDISERKDGLIDYIKPQAIARKSTQEEIDLALESSKRGPPLFLATVHAGHNQLLTDEAGKFVITRIPEEVYWHQCLIVGKVGTGKTVGGKYLAQHFVEDMGGAVIAINVKDNDLLRMDQPSVTNSPEVKAEWASLGTAPHGITNFTVYHPATTTIGPTKGVTPGISTKITLNVKEIDPEALTGLLNNISDVAAQSLPNIFRAWQEQMKQARDQNRFTFSEFVRYFQAGENDKLVFRTLNTRGEEGTVPMHRSTYGNVLRNLDAVVEFFDNPDAQTLTAEDILQRGKMSVIDVTSKNGIQFGAVLLRQLLHQIVASKSEQRSTVPILIMIDEVHMFYGNQSTAAALGDLDLICRTGRSMGIGVVFLSQNPADLPSGLSSVINTKIFFKSDGTQARSYGITVNDKEIGDLKKGFAAVSIHELSQVKIVKFPLAYAGVL